MKQQAEKSAGVQEKYAALEAQYQALAAIVSASEGTEAIAKVSNIIDFFFIKYFSIFLYRTFAPLSKKCLNTRMFHKHYSKVYLIYNYRYYSCWLFRMKVLT